VGCHSNAGREGGGIGEQAGPSAGIRAFLKYSPVLIALVALCVGWIFYSRWQHNRAIQQKIQQKQAAKRRADAENINRQFGGAAFPVLNFYADPPAPRRGETADLCYGVANAKSVRLKPPAGPVWPSSARCLQVAPEKTTTSTLTAVDAAGRTKAAKATIQLR
jgi:hypothetical protein